ncbi:hypothetical protein GALL_356480 [mine drainage metagenome]|uniref:Uncharacterized protein n=1 Tax=mine drainage metagenome TaxID=410659 RepID=A0A1J5QH52_9ZZZZ
MLQALRHIGNQLRPALCAWPMLVAALIMLWSLSGRPPQAAGGWMAVIHVIYVLGIVWLLTMATTIAMEALGSRPGGLTPAPGLPDIAPPSRKPASVSPRVHGRGRHPLRFFAA